MHEMLELFKQASIEAGKEIMQVYATDFAVQSKADHSPVTEADARAEKVILTKLRAAMPDIPIVAEEEMSAGLGPDAVGDKFILVDPLDGTREFTKRSGEFTVNIALIEDGLPICGVVYAPPLKKLFYGAHGLGAFEKSVDCETGQRKEAVSVQARIRPETDWIAVASASHRSPETNEFLEQYPIGEIKSMGSSLKLCLVATGEADVYPRLGRTMEWDIAAGHAVLWAAGGQVETMDGGAFTYGKAGFENPHFIAWGRES